MAIYHEWNGTVLTITSDSGTSSADLRGEMGVRGPQGIPGGTGADGNVHFEELTEEQKAQLRGEPGPEGPAGKQGNCGSSIWAANVSYEELGDLIFKNDIQPIAGRYLAVGDLVFLADGVVIRIDAISDTANDAFEYEYLYTTPEGPAGESGVYIGETAPKDTNVWINPNGTATAPDAFATKQYVDDLINSLPSGSGSDCEGCVKSVNNQFPDENGNVVIEVPTVEDIIKALPLWEGGEY